MFKKNEFQHMFLHIFCYKFTKVYYLMSCFKWFLLQHY